jgi:ribosomal-protein-alanine N-acetyltransferase
LLEGKNVNLRIMEKEHVPLLVDWWSDPDFGEYKSPTQTTRAGMEKFLESSVFEPKGFIIEKKNGSRIGYIWHFSLLSPYMNMLEIGYGLIPSERGKGYCTEATQLMVDYLFLSKDVTRIIATTHPKNVISQRILDKAGFKREGTMRKCYFCRGEWTDMFLFSILREEWKEPRILTKTKLPS